MLYPGAPRKRDVYQDLACPNNGHVRYMRLIRAQGTEEQPCRQAKCLSQSQGEGAASRRDCTC